MSKHNKVNPKLDKTAERKFFLILIGIAIVLMGLMYWMFSANS